MPEEDNVLIVVRQWVQKAENDLKTARHILKMEDDCPADTVCFHAQQCVEKYLKAGLVLKGTDFPKTHNISELIALLPKTVRHLLTDEEQERLTDYATVTRYPGDYDAIPVSEARNAIRLARRVRGAIRKLLPKSLL